MYQDVHLRNPGNLVRKYLCHVVLKTSPSCVLFEMRFSCSTKDIVCSKLYTVSLSIFFTSVFFRLQSTKRGWVSCLLHPSQHQPKLRCLKVKFNFIRWRLPCFIVLLSNRFSWFLITSRQNKKELCTFVVDSNWNNLSILLKLLWHLLDSSLQ